MLRLKRKRESLALYSKPAVIEGDAEEKGDHGLGPRGGRCREEACGGLGWAVSGDGLGSLGLTSVVAGQRGTGLDRWRAGLALIDGETRRRL
ncbi:hypothetical protein M0R45_008217 [Rubus argutus]|uniref:Uncharacterized protein n=1 Tax=Rubus argutus TaxID=59490 RepID=A0AAW1Y142_RUBAR